MKRTLAPHLRALLFALFGLFFLSPAPEAVHAQDDEDEYGVDWTADDHACRCKAGNGCSHYLRAPVEPVWDPCWCNFCTKRSQHDGTRAMPKSFSRLCASGNKMENYLRRHARSWDMVCSERNKTLKACRMPYPHNCPECETKGDPWRKEDQEEVEWRQKREAKLFGSRKTVVVWSPHFYVVTDIPSLKIKTRGGSFRVLRTHEIAHLYAERCEKAYRDFVRAFGEDVTLSKPAGVFLPKKESTAAKIQALYNSSAKTNLVYGGSSDGKVGDGFCFNGFTNSLQKAGGNDTGLHHAVRHMVGHLLISCWTKVDGKNRVLPRWLFEGVAHWLAKLPRPLHDEVVWCADEGTPLSGSGKGWAKDARKIAASSKTDPIETLLGKSTIGLLTVNDHVRAWSYVHLGLAEDRERFVATMADLRQPVAVRKAWMDNLGCTPEEWHDRWEDRVLGRRPTLGELSIDEAGDEGPGAAERAAIRRETNLVNLAARIRSIGTCEDPKTAKVLVDQFGRPSDAIRETLVVVLSRTEDEDTLTAIREHGLFHQAPMVRAYTARVLGNAGDEESIEPIRGLVEDKFWLVRAEMAFALAKLKDPDLVNSVKPLLDDSSAKVRIAAMDSVAAAGRSGEKVVSRVAANLDHRSWQVRSAAADSLGGIGAMTGVGPLITRMTTEAGRIRKDCHNALKAITADDLGQNPEYWAKWWKREREKVGGGIPEGPKEEPDTSYDEERYGLKRPPNYGLRVFSDRVGYVLDISNSMFTLFEPDEQAVKRLRRTYKGATKFDISKEEIVQSVQSLDPRARFTICVFSNKPRFMSKKLVAATPDKHKKAASFLRSCRGGQGSGGPQMTNFYDAFRAILDLPKGHMPPPGFRDTPDTMFFLTDGAPTLGEIIEADEILSWFNGLNRYARIKVHVVAYGTMGIDLPFLRNLATNNRGEFIHLPESKKTPTEPLPGSTPK
ncbi:MAG: HEAT repeat domain-containing protein [Planctomycetota bacterium]